MKNVQSLFTLGICLLIFLLPTDTFASEKWTVKGTLKVNHGLGFMKDYYGESSPLAGVQVKVYARAKNFAGWGTWNSWTVVRTKSDGTFSVSKETGTDRRQFKIEILFDSNELRIKEGQETSITFGGDGFPIDINIDLTDKDWHEIYNEKEDGPSDGHRAGTVQVGTLSLKGNNVLRKHGDIWSLYNKVFDLFDGYGSDYGFKDKVVIKFPMGIGNNASNSASYANPLNNHIYIKEEDFDGNAILHELMHIWAYHHSTGEDGMAWQLVKHGTTHDAREATTFVPFHEAFAEYAAYKTLKELTGLNRFNNDDDDFTPHRPYSRSYIGAIEPILANVDYTERGWYSLFNVLTFGNLDRVNFNEGSKFAESTYGDCQAAEIDYSFKEVLSIFLKHSSKGVSKYLAKDEEDFRSFLNRAQKILPNMTDERVKEIKSYVNPAATANPHDNYCGISSIKDKLTPVKNPNINKANTKPVNLKQKN
ncbi:MAG: hypothetical protein R2824_08375 [Saprospiraceae bacterium]